MLISKTVHTTILTVWSILMILIQKNIKVDKKSGKDILLYNIKYETLDGVKTFILKT